jgi:hypothetical protein
MSILYAATLRRRSIKVGVAIVVIQNIKTRRQEQMMLLLEMLGVHHRRLLETVGTPLLTHRVAMDGMHPPLLPEMDGMHLLLLLEMLLMDGVTHLPGTQMTVESQLQMMKAARGGNSMTRRMKER